MSVQSQAEPRRTWTFCCVSCGNDMSHGPTAICTVDLVGKHQWVRVDLREDRAVSADIEAVAEALRGLDNGAWSSMSEEYRDLYRDRAHVLLAAVFHEVADA
jgi:hypothetical protein